MMVNVDNQRPGDSWIIQGDRYDVLLTPEFVKDEGVYIYMRHRETGQACVVAILPRTSEEIEAIVVVAGL